jgi:predicted dehydrogenase
MLEKENLDIVTVATSDHARAALVVDAAEAGVKRIFCEKPLARTVEDADPIVSACERHNVILSIDHTRRWTPI